MTRSGIKKRRERREKRPIPFPASTPPIPPPVPPALEPAPAIPPAVAPPPVTEEQLKQFKDVVLKSINRVFEQDFENWSENYNEAVHGKS
jgi:hypothetical protein